MFKRVLFVDKKCLFLSKRKNLLSLPHDTKTQLNYSCSGQKLFYARLSIYTCEGPQHFNFYFLCVVIVKEEKYKHSQATAVCTEK